MSSPSFLDRVNEYLALRRGLGFDLETPSWLLFDFARYADRVGHQAGHVTTDLAVQWALSSRSRDPAQAIRRLSTVRVFARYLAVLDPSTEIPPVGLLGRLPRRKQPHIYNDAEGRRASAPSQSVGASRRPSSQNLRRVLLASAIERVAALRGQPPHLQGR